MPFKSKERAKEWKRDWRSKNKDKEKDYRKRHANRKRIRAQERREALRKLRTEVFGDICVLCKQPRNVLHEIHGRPHIKEGDNSETKLRYPLKHKEDFVPLCTMEHRLVHLLMALFNLSWEDILDLHERGGSTPTKVLRYLRYVVQDIPETVD